MEWNGFYGTDYKKRTDYKKETFFSRLLKKKGRRTLHLRSIYSKEKKWNKSEKDMVLTVYFFLCQECFVAEIFKTGRTLHRKDYYFNA